MHISMEMLWWGMPRQSRGFEKMTRKTVKFLQVGINIPVK
jgi:hypothetical protein